MGEKGNLTSEELLAVTSSATEPSGMGAVVAGAGTTVTAVFQETAGSLKDKVVDKGLDAGITEAQQRLKERRAAKTPEGTDPAP